MGQVESHVRKSLDWQNVLPGRGAPSSVKRSQKTGRLQCLNFELERPQRTWHKPNRPPKKEARLQTQTCRTLLNLYLFVGRKNKCTLSRLFCFLNPHFYPFSKSCRFESRRHSRVVSHVIGRNRFPLLQLLKHQHVISFYSSIQKEEKRFRFVGWLTVGDPLMARCIRLHI